MTNMTDGAELASTIAMPGVQITKATLIVTEAAARAAPSCESDMYLNNHVVDAFN